MIGKELGNSDFFEIEPKCLLFSGQFAWEGAIALTVEKHANNIASHRYYTIKGKKEHCYSEYLWAFFRTKYGESLLNKCSHGAAGRNRPLNFKELLNEYISLPSLDIQKEIATHVEKLFIFRIEVSKFESLLTEYKTRLISDVATGKVDVRDVIVPGFDIEEMTEEIVDNMIDKEEQEEEF